MRVKDNVIAATFLSHALYADLLNRYGIDACSYNDPK